MANTLDRWQPGRVILVFTPKGYYEAGSPEDLALQAKINAAAAGSAYRPADPGDCDRPAFLGEARTWTNLQSGNPQKVLHYSLEYSWRFCYLRPNRDNKTVVATKSVIQNWGNDILAQVPELDKFINTVEQLHGKRFELMGVADTNSLFDQGEDYVESKGLGCVTPAFTYDAAKTAAKLAVTNLAPGACSSVKLRVDAATWKTYMSGDLVNAPLSGILNWEAGTGLDLTDLEVSFGVEGLHHVVMSPKNDTMKVYHPWYVDESATVTTADGLPVVQGRRWDFRLGMGRPTSGQTQNFGGNINSPGWDTMADFFVAGDGDCLGLVIPPTINDLKFNGDGALKAVNREEQQFVDLYIGLRNAGSANQTGHIFIHDMVSTITDRDHRWSETGRGNAFVRVLPFDFI